MSHEEIFSKENSIYETWGTKRSKTIGSNERFGNAYIKQKR